MTHLLMKKVRVNLINLEEPAAVICTEGQVHCQRTMLGLTRWHLIRSVWYINGYSLHNMIVIAPHSTRAASYIVLLTSNTKRRAFFLVRRHSETDTLESSLISVTSYSSITIRVLACIFPNFRQWKKDFTMIKFSRECRKFFISHVNCLNSGKNRKSKFHFNSWFVFLGSVPYEIGNSSFTWNGLDIMS